MTRRLIHPLSRFQNVLAKSVWMPLLLCCVAMFAPSIAMLSVATQSAAADPNAEDQLTGALEAWRNGDAETARQQFSVLIDRGTRDPRPYFYRGLIAEQFGENGDDDFETGASLEAARSATTLVNRSLEKTQGPVRARIEKIRQAARGKLKSDPQAAKMAATYRDALEARSQGDLATAAAKLEEIADGKDPRYAYMYGVVMAESGDIEAAQQAFAVALRKEQSPKDVELVSRALANIQGPIRQMIEEQSVEGPGGQLITRQMNLRTVVRRARMTEDEMIAEANEAKAEEALMVDQRANARRMAAAAEIAADRAAREERANLLSQPPSEMNPEPVLADAGNDTEAMPAEASEVMAEVDADDESNPFLGGTAKVPSVAAAVAFAAPASSVDAGPIDLAYLPETAELVIYLRPADMLKSGFMSPLTELPDFASEQAVMKNDIGFAVEDVDTVTVGVANLISSLIPLMAGANTGAPPDPAAMAQKMLGGENGVAVVRTSSDQDISGYLMSQGATTMDVDGKTVYVMASPDGKSPNMAIYLADARTMVFASEDGIGAAIARESVSEPRPEFDFVSRSSHVVLAFASPILAGMSGSIPQVPPTVPPQVTQLVDALRGNIAGGAISLSAGSDMDLAIALNLVEQSSDASDGLDGSLALGKQMAPLLLGGAPPAIQPSMQRMIGSLTSSSNGTVLTASATIPNSLVKALQENPELLGPIAAGREAARRTQQKNKLKQVALSMHNYHAVYNHFPAVDGDGNGQNGLSWRVHLLPYMEQAELYQQFHLDEPWDSEHNMALIPFMPETFKVDGVDEPGMTTMHVFSDAKCPFEEGVAPSLRNITDGSSNTIMAVVAGPETAAAWTRPGGLAFDESDPIQVLGTIGEQFEAVLMDGSVRTISAAIDAATLGLLIQHQDNQPVSF